MGKSKEDFLSMREEEIDEEYKQDILFLLQSEEEAYDQLKEEANQELGKILIEKEVKNGNEKSNIQSR